MSQFFISRQQMGEAQEFCFKHNLPAPHFGMSVEAQELLLELLWGKHLLAIGEASDGFRRIHFIVSSISTEGFDTPVIGTLGQIDQEEN